MGRGAWGSPPPSLDQHRFQLGFLPAAKPTSPKETALVRASHLVHRLVGLGLPRVLLRSTSDAKALLMLRSQQAAEAVPHVQLRQKK